MNKFIIVFLACSIWMPSGAGQDVGMDKQPLGLTSFLKIFYDVSGLPSYASKTYSAETSTYDRTGLNNDGFNGTYSFIRKNADSSLVIFDVKGAGLINRIWTPTPSDDSLDFYIDDTVKASCTICYRDLFSGKVYPFIAPLCDHQLGGNYCYLPIPFNESCKIVFRGKKTQFHQIGYRLYPKGTRVQKFSLPLNTAAQQALAKIKSIWDNPSLSVKDLNQHGLPVSATDKNVLLRAGQKATVFETRQPGRIMGFSLSPVDLDSIAKDIDLRIIWDDDSLPAVYCPLADYFGYAFGKPSMKSLLIGSDGGTNYSWFPMPFDKSARIELLYRKSAHGDPQRDIHFQCKTLFSPQKRDTANEGRFYTCWNRENPVPSGLPHHLLDIKGRGHFVGTALQAQGLKAGMTIFFEGDDSTVVDGELRMHGTGSEDFFNGGWYALLDTWDAAMSLPLSGALAYSIPFCRTGGYRLFVSDKISFEQSFFLSIEHGPAHNLLPADYSSVSYYYCDVHNRQRLIPSQENTKGYMPDTLMLYPQLLNMAFEGKATVETKWAFPIDGETFYFTVDDDTKCRVSLQDIPPGHYRLNLDYVKSPGGAMFSLWQHQTQMTDWIDTRKDTIERVALQELSDLVITPLNNTLSFHFKTKEDRNQFILNRIILVKK